MEEPSDSIASAAGLLWPYTQLTKVCSFPGALSAHLHHVSHNPTPLAAPCVLSKGGRARPWATLPTHSVFLYGFHWGTFSPGVIKPQGTLLSGWLSDGDLMPRGWLSGPFLHLGSQQGSLLFASAHRRLLSAPTLPLSTVVTFAKAFGAHLGAPGSHPLSRAFLTFTKSPLSWKAACLQTPGVRTSLRRGAFFSLPRTSGQATLWASSQPGGRAPAVVDRWPNHETQFT